MSTNNSDHITTVKQHVRRTQ